MTHNEAIWIIVGIATFAGTIGLVVGLREVVYRLNSIPVQNRLVRRGDIELGDYIQPNQHYYPDLIESPARVYESFLNNDRVPSYFTGNPSYHTGTIPSYHTYERLNINSSLENSIDLDFIILLFLVLIFGLVTIINRKAENNYPIFSKSISTEEITYINIYQQIHEGKLITYGKFYTYVLFSKWTIFDIKSWMSTFDDIDYAVTIELIGESYPDLYKNEPRLILSWQFIVNKGSSPLLISSHIQNQLDKLECLFDVELDNDYSGNSEPKPCILITITELKY